MELYIVPDGKLVGVVLDLSLRHIGGHRIIDTVKKQLVDFVRQYLGGEDLLYLYHPFVFEPAETIGPIVSSIGNYETDGWVFDLNAALIQTYYILAAEDIDFDKTYLLITDRIQDSAAIDKLFRLEDRDETESRFILVGIGNQYERQVLMDRSANYLHFDDPSTLSKMLLRICEET
ncbi:MAG: hypothetical protein ACXADB_09525 [Candidatus Hermodarchaeia archaeon]